MFEIDVNKLQQRESRIPSERGSEPEPMQSSDESSRVKPSRKVIKKESAIL